MSGIADEEEYFDQVVEAKRQNYRFIKVFLHRDRIGRGQSEILISGCVGIQGSKVGTGGIGGLAEYEFRTVHSDEMRFTFDRNEREYVCHLLDDQGPGYFSEVGYNRDLLASHLNENYFVIQDASVLKDIQKRHALLLSNGGKKVKMKKAPVLDNNSTSEDIDAQIKFLEEKKKLLSDESSHDIQVPLNEDKPTLDKPTPAPPVDLIAEDKARAKIEANKKRVDKQRLKRQADKKAKEDAKKSAEETVVA